MAHSAIPTTDANNPFYCPSVPAALFLESIRQKIRQSGQNACDSSRENTPELIESSHEDLFPSFTKLLDQSMCEEDMLELLYRPDNRLLGSAGDSSFSSVCPSGPFLAYGRGFSRTSKSSPGISSGFSDFAMPARREMSIVDVNDGSFELSAKADKIHFFSHQMLPSPDEPPARTTRMPRNARSSNSAEALLARVRALEGVLFRKLSAPHSRVEIL